MYHKLEMTSINTRIKVHQPLNIDLRAQKTQTKFYTVIENYYLTRRSFESISIKELCAKADVSRATFYRHHEEIIQIVEVQLLRNMQQFSKKLDQITLSCQNIQQLIISLLQEKQQLFQIIAWSKAESIFLDVIAGEILRICLLKEITFSDNHFVPNYLARMILNLGLEISPQQRKYTNQQLYELISETIHFLAK